MSRRLLAVTGTGQVSGAERVLLRALAAALADGWRVSCLAPPGRATEELVAAGVEVVAIPELGGLGPSITTRWATTVRTLRRQAAKADVVLVNSLAALPVVRASSCPAPVVWLAHDVVVRCDRLWAVRWSWPALAHVVAVSGAVASRLPVSGGCGTSVVHNGVPAPSEPVTSPASLPSSPVVGLNAALTPWKGHHVLLDAVAHLDDGVRVELVGGALDSDAGYAAQLSTRVAREWRETPERVSMVGHVDDPASRMRTWSVAVSASVLPEACPLAVLEAMSLGVPVVATDHGGSPEVLAGAGLLVPPRDPVALARGVSRLLTDAGLWERCRDAGLARIAACHRLDRQLDSLLAVVSQVARTGSGPRSPCLEVPR